MVVIAAIIGLLSHVKNVKISIGKVVVPGPVRKSATLTSVNEMIKEKIKAAIIPEKVSLKVTRKKDCQGFAPRVLSAYSKEGFNPAMIE